MNNGQHLVRFLDVHAKTNKTTNNMAGGGIDKLMYPPYTEMEVVKGGGWHRQRDKSENVKWLSWNEEERMREADTESKRDGRRKTKNWD